ncbi:hypothetical protein BZA77DRAFT_288962 [Pyronema omphalodes]|nr:hypothetical protein BZA77DRAFT_288962 [Pyronema omphalodes]
MPAISPRNYSDSFGSHRLGFTDKMLKMALDVFGSHRGSFGQDTTSMLQARDTSEHLKPGFLDRLNPEPENWAVWQFVIFFMAIAAVVFGIAYVAEYNHRQDNDRMRAMQFAEYELENINTNYGSMRRRAGSVSGRL